MPTLRYRALVLHELLGHGIRPRQDTDPALVRAHLNELYTFELRRLRGELVQAEARAGRKLRQQYGERVLELRGRYGLLSSPVASWVDAT